ncbi:MAG: relaxase/mobilization nuclease domain-containing protein [Dysgonomonas sp.]|nr:relaxase/mobilization nuclease domain-containing protein [Dysgonomonas sp.]
MIAKNIKGKSFKGCVNYVMNDTAQLLEAEGVFADSTKSMIRSFAMQRSGRKEIKQPVGHIPIAFSPEDKVRMTDDFMLQLAKEYMQEMGIKNTQYIIVRHDNTGNPHLHIVYNRINNDLKLISVNHDYKRNIKVCKKLKDKYNLTYGKGKEKVKREKLGNPDKVKYYIYDAIKSVLPTCKTPADLRFALQKFGIEFDYKHKKTTNEIEGVSFRYNNVAFKGSQIDRKFSFGNLKKEFEKNIRILQEQTAKTQEQQEKQPSKVQQQTENKPKNPAIGGVELTPKQWEILKNGGHIYLENMRKKDGNGSFSLYVFLNDEKNKVLFSSKNPDEFVKYGKYEMRVRDRILIEKGYFTKAKVKWYGGGFAYPYLWKSNKADIDYQESWNDPRIKRKEKQDQKFNSSSIQKKNRGRKM